MYQMRAFCGVIIAGDFDSGGIVTIGDIRASVYALPGRAGSPGVTSHSTPVHIARHDGWRKSRSSMRQLVKVTFVYPFFAAARIEIAEDSCATTSSRIGKGALSVSVAEMANTPLPASNNRIGIPR